MWLMAFMKIYSCRDSNILWKRHKTKHNQYHGEISNGASTNKRPVSKNGNNGGAAGSVETSSQRNRRSGIGNGSQRLGKRAKQAP